MTIKHHLTEEILTGYAVGILPEAFGLVVATHISMCDECRARLLAMEALGGGVVETCDTVDMADDAFAMTMARIEASDDAAPAFSRPRKVSDLPAPLCDYVGGNLAGAQWKSVGGGVQQMHLKTATGAKARLVRIPGGVAIPDHSHNGMELTLVLKGAFRDGHGRFARGDIDVADEGVDHTPIAEEGEDCICLAATDAPLRFKSWLPRIVQPFVGI